MPATTLCTGLGASKNLGLLLIPEFFSLISVTGNKGVLTKRFSCVGLPATYRVLDPMAGIM
jgi:hypothetical protein